MSIQAKTVYNVLRSKVEVSILFKYTFKLHEMIAKGIDKLIEWSLQRQANKQFKKKKK